MYTYSVREQIVDNFRSAGKQILNPPRFLALLYTVVYACAREVAFRQYLHFQNQSEIDEDGGKRMAHLRPPSRRNQAEQNHQHRQLLQGPRLQGQEHGKAH